MCKAYRTVSYEASCVLSHVLPLPNKVAELTSLRSVKSSGVFQVAGDSISIQRSVISGRHPGLCVLGFVDLASKHCSTEFCIYTDGSKSEDGVGSAFVVYNRSVEIHHRIFSLPHFCSVFQAELLALKKSLEYLLDELPSSPVRIFSDSLSSLMAIQDRNSDTPLVVEIQDLLVLLRRMEVSVRISWVKAHVGIEGNERADQLAKSCWTNDAEPVDLDAPFSFAKRHTRLTERTKWNDDWKKSENGAWTRRIFPTIEHRRKAGKLGLDFVLTQFLSGHGKFGSYLTRFKLRTDPSCECGVFQDPEHLIFDCPLLADLREDILSEFTQRGKQFSLASIGPLLADHFTHDLFNSFLQSSHRRLVLWEG